MHNIDSIRDKGCIFCTKPDAGDDRESLILYRGETAFVIMNLYPYNTGHVMVAPFRHVGELEDLSEDEIAEVMALTSMSIKAIKREMQPQLIENHYFQIIVAIYLSCYLNYRE